MPVIRHTCLSDCITHVESVTPDTACSILIDRFHRSDDLMVVPIISRDNKIVGLIDRDRLTLALSGKFGHSLYANRPISKIMDSNPVIIDGAARLETMIIEMMNNRLSDMLRGFVVIEDGMYRGIGTGLSLLRSLSHDLSASLESQKSLTQHIITLNHETQKQKAFLDTVIEHLPAMVMVKNVHDKRISLLNQTGANILGIEAKEALGKNSEDLFSPELSARIHEYDTLALQSLESVVVEETIEDARTKKRHTLQLKKAVLYDSDNMAEAIITVGVDLTEQKEAQEKIAHLAHYDSLTGLSNRALFAAHFEAALDDSKKTQRQYALLCLDLDRFKYVNDSFGHLVGDKLLQAFAMRLRSHLRQDTFVARLGGDEFAILLPIKSQHEAENLAARLIKMASDVFMIEDYSIEIGLSVGIALAPLHSTSPQSLHAKADLALYSVKSLGRKQWRIYDDAMDSALQVNLKLEKELIAALDEKQFELFYQPLVNACTGRVESHEALLRWRHPQRGFVAPSSFIPVAEENGLIVPIGEWVLNEACQNAAEWPENQRVAVNVSPIQFRRQGLVRTVKKALKKSGLAPNRLELEITEGVLMEDVSRNMNLLSELKALGVRIALDDFGTGFSSLSYLRNFTYDKIKIDRSFINDLGKDKNAISIIRAIIEMARSLEVMVTAEGVETREQYETLCQLKCDQIQGYYFGRPQPLPVWDCPNLLKFVA